ncbi:MAG: hypothetical protein EXS33_01035 [Pedosphaera sp.]|nr:hypothetical protein [Pedosphaera sp.]
MKKIILLPGLAVALAGFACAEIVILKDGPGKTPDAPGIDVPPPASNPEAARGDTLELLNGDVLHGTFISLDSKNGARWQHPSVKQVMELNPAGIGRIKLDRPKSTNAAPRQTCAARLTNGDELVGELVMLDDDKLILETWYAGTLTLPRKMVQSLSPGLSRLSSVFEGPTGPEGWTIKGTGGGGFRAMRPGREGGSWKFSNGGFTSVGQGSVGRDVKLPAMSNIEFDMSWRGYLQLNLAFYTDTLDGYAGNCYLLSMNYTSLNLQRMSRTGDSGSFGQAEVPSLNQKTKAHFSLRVNKEQKTIALLMDGALIKQWTDRGDFAGSGTGLLFNQQGQGFVRVSNIRVTTWDGKFEESTGKTAKSKDDLVRLVNNDKISGTLKSIKDGKMNFETAFAPLSVPLDRIDQIDLAGEKAEKAASGANDVRVSFGDRGSVTFQLERWDDQQVTGSSLNFGKARFSPAAFSSIQFNLDKQKPEQDLIDPLENGGGLEFEK